MPADVVTFELDELLCAIEAAPVVEIVRAVALRPIPGQPPFIAGVIDVRGAIVPVLDLRVRFGRPAKRLSPSHRYVLVRIRALIAALWVDRIVNVVSLRDDAIVEPHGFVVGAQSLVGVGKTADGMVMIHDADAFLTQSEADGLAIVGAAR